MNNPLINQFLPNNKSIKMAIGIAILSMLSACGDGKESAAKAGQSIVSVNGEEITVHQVNSALQRTQIDPKQKEQAAKQIVKSLIDQQILVQAAMDAKLDRNPQVMTAIEESKQQILAKAYLQSKVSNISKPTDSDIMVYHDAHPNVFSNRKLYAMEEITFAVSPDQIKALEDLSNTAKTTEEVIVWLNQNQIKFNTSKKVHAAESLPMKLLDKMSVMQVNELIFVNGPGQIVVGKLLETRTQPIPLSDAKPLIERAIMNEKQQKAAQAEMERLIKSAKIVYLDKNYDLSATQNATASAKPEVKAEEKSDSKAEQAEKKVEDHIEKGLSGL
jgi:peptidyl-prolyl cis-trans isomerase C